MISQLVIINNMRWRLHMETRKVVEGNFFMLQAHSVLNVTILVVWLWIRQYLTWFVRESIRHFSLSQYQPKPNVADCPSLEAPFLTTCFEPVT